MSQDRDEQTVVWFSIPLDGDTIDRLMHLSDICHAEPVKVAASLLRDILSDDAMEHGEIPFDGAAAPRLN